MYVEDIGCRCMHAIGSPTCIMIWLLVMCALVASGSDGLLDYAPDCLHGNSILYVVQCWLKGMREATLLCTLVPVTSA